VAKPRALAPWVSASVHRGTNLSRSNRLSRLSPVPEARWSRAISADSLAVGSGSPRLRKLSAVDDTGGDCNETSWIYRSMDKVGTGALTLGRPRVADLGADPRRSLFVGSEGFDGGTTVPALLYEEARRSGSRMVLGRRGTRRRDAGGGRPIRTPREEGTPASCPRASFNRRRGPRRRPGGFADPPLYRGGTRALRPGVRTPRSRPAPLPPQPATRRVLSFASLESEEQGGLDQVRREAGCSGSTPRRSGRKPHISRQPSGLATKPGEICGLASSRSRKSECRRWWIATWMTVRAWARRHRTHLER
jgi:hypothetical protein